MRHFDVLIVGGGQAGRRAAEGARSVSPDISIAIIGNENHPPYDRPQLSKEALIAGPLSHVASSAEIYAERNIDLILGQWVSHIEPMSRTVTTAVGHVFGYGNLVLATGSRPRPLPFATDAADRVLTLRTREDAERLHGVLKPGTRLAIIGGGFIGLEVATAAVAQGATVTVAEAADRILARTLPEVVAQRIAQAHQLAGVDLRTSTQVKGIKQDGSDIRLDLGSTSLLVDWVLVGIGIIPNTELAHQAGLVVMDGIVVDETGATSEPHIFAAGEVTCHPVLGGQEPMRLECWQAAEIQAETAGKTAAGSVSSNPVSPWFWSDQAGLNIQMLGHVLGRELIERDYGGGAVSYLALGPLGELEGVITINAGKDISAARRMIGSNTPLDRVTATDPTVALRRLVS